MNVARRAQEYVRRASFMGSRQILAGNTEEVTNR
jgi:hypothetical protein